jgi:hypothetical protein
VGGAKETFNHFIKEKKLKEAKKKLSCNFKREAD